MKKNKQGFTLIELLVVIAIIGLLSTLSIVALNQARARSRDARRIADIKQIQTAVEMYYNDLGAYPTSITGGSNIATGSPLVVYMDVVPKPPVPLIMRFVQEQLFILTRLAPSTALLMVPIL